MIPGQDIAVSEPKITNSYGSAVTEIIRAAFLLGGEHFPFNPHRGIDLDQFLFEGQSEAMLSAQIAYLEQEVKQLDPRIKEVKCTAKFEGPHITSIEISVVTINGEISHIGIPNA